MPTDNPLAFAKYHGTGNDFILIDNRGSLWHEILSPQDIQQLCHRRFGIGADGLMFLENSPQADFHMRYYNADGHEGSFCGNGGRCITAFAVSRGIQGPELIFTAADGRHHARHLPTEEVTLKMQDVSEVVPVKDGLWIDTGSPHLVVWSENVAHFALDREGPRLRHLAQFRPSGGVNVNVVQRPLDQNEVFLMRTFERGVEDETWSCGTGTVAAALASHHQAGGQPGAFQYHFHTKGGLLSVSGQCSAPGSYYDIWLTGPTTFVFSGQVALAR